MNLTTGKCRPAALWLQACCLALGFMGVARGLTLRETSVPVGILDRTTQPGTGTPVTTLTAPDRWTTFRFVEWTLNGVRFSDATAAAANPCSFTINTATDAVAIYLPESEDADSDALPDWWERRYFGSLQYTGTENPDLDANNNAQEYVLNTHPGVYDPVPPAIDREYAAGGVSRRRSLQMPIIQDWGRYGLLRENSQPAGVILQERIVEKGLSISLANPPASSGGYHFTGWLKNGVRLDSPTAIQPIPVVPLQNIETFTARYIPSAEDVDGDGVPDWREWLLFESLQYDGSSDPDGDGFTWAEEDVRGFSTLVPNQLVGGGISRRRSQMLFVDTTGRLPFRQTSNPATILEQTEYLPPGTVVTVPSRAGHIFANYQFCYWILDGVRQEDASGIAVSGFSFDLTSASTAVAVYIDPTVDTDSDGIKDWREWSDYGSLQYDPASDTDGDGFTYADEMARNQSPRVANEFVAGGVSRRRSQMFFVDATGRLPLRLTSNPETILEQTEYYAPATMVTLPQRAGHTFANYRFAWWDLNGQRLEDASGVALSTHVFPLNAASTGTARYFVFGVDGDSDGIEDMHEWIHYGSLEQNAASDTDDDGFTYAEELTRNQSPRVRDDLAAGGVSRRRSLLVNIDPNLTPTAPEIGSLFATDVGTTTVTFRALVNPMSAATIANFNYGETVSYGSQVTSTSVLNGFSASPMDASVTGLQPGTTYHFQVVATNGFGSRASQNVTFTTLLNPLSYRAWELGYSLIGGKTDDDDSDGVANVLEYAFGMDPTDSGDQELLPKPEFVAGRWRLRFIPLSSVIGVSYRAEWSTNLRDWNPCVNHGNPGTYDFWTPLGAGENGTLLVRWAVAHSDE